MKIQNTTEQFYGKSYRDVSYILMELQNSDTKSVEVRQPRINLRLQTNGMPLFVLCIRNRKKEASLTRRDLLVRHLLLETTSGELQQVGQDTA